MVYQKGLVLERTERTKFLSVFVYLSREGGREREGGSGRETETERQRETEADGFKFLFSNFFVVSEKDF